MIKRYALPYVICLISAMMLSPIFILISMIGDPLVINIATIIFTMLLLATVVFKVRYLVKGEIK